MNRASIFPQRAENVNRKCKQTIFDTCSKPQKAHLLCTTRDFSSQNSMEKEAAWTWIVSCYSQLKAQGPPLRHVNVNYSPTGTKYQSPTKKNSSVDVPQNLDGIYKLCLNAIDLVLNRVNALNSVDSAYVKLASECFTKLYELDLANNMSDVTKRHNSFIVKLIELENRCKSTDYATTVCEIRSCMFHSKDEAFDVLSDCSSLPTWSDNDKVLKLFMIQVIYKLFQRENYAYASDILTFFLNERITPTMDGFQLRSVIKLVLSLGRVAPSVQFKTCMHLKFLNYVERFNLKFSDFILTGTFETFVENLESTLLSMEILDKVPLYYHQFACGNYSDNFQSVNARIVSLCSDLGLDWELVVADSVRSNIVIKLLNNANLNSALVATELDAIKRPTSQLMDSLGQYILKLKFKKGDDVSTLLTFYANHSHSLTKETNKVFDKTLINAKLIDAPDQFWEQYLMKLFKLYSHCGDTKRLRNLSNLSFNLKYFEQSLLVERDLFLRNQNTSDLDIKFKKALQILKGNITMISKLSSIIFNSAFLSQLNQGLLEKFDTFERKFGGYLLFQNLNAFRITDLSEGDKAMVFCLATKYCTDVDFVNLFQNLAIGDQILQMLCGIFCKELPILKVQRISTITTTNYDHLIKCFYYLSVEIRAKSTLNLPKILNIYLNSWVPRNRSRVTSFETTFLEQFVGYLKFFGYHKALKRLFSSIEVYLKDANETFKVWFLSESLENMLTLREVLKLLPGNFDGYVEDHGDKFQYIVSVLPFKLLKLKYFMVNFDQEGLTDTAYEIYQIIDSYPGIFSIENKCAFPRDKFITVLKLLVKVMLSRSKFLWVKGCHMESITSAVASIQLAKSVLKTDQGNLQIIRSMMSAFRNVINTLIHLGLSKDADYYVGEFKKVNDSVSKYKMVFVQNCYFMAHYYHVSGKVQECLDIKTQADQLFDSLRLINTNDDDEKYVDNYKLIYYRLLSDIYHDDVGSQVEARRNLKAFLLFMEKEGKVLANVWRLNYEYHFNSEVVDLTLNTSKNPYLHAMNYMLNSRRLFINAQNSLNMDPLYSTMEDSAMAIPSIVKKFDVAPVPQLPQKAKSNSVKNVKKAITGMRQSKGMIVQLISVLRYLANYQRNEIHRVLSLDLLTLSSISNSYNSNDSFEECILLNNHVKTQPFLSEKAMINITSNTGKKIPEFDADLPSSMAVEFEKPDISLIRDQNWQILSIDVSSINDELIITRLDEAPKMLKLPLTRLFVRTGEDPNFKLNDCLNELKQIIKESDKTMSQEVVSSIDTAEQRKEWHTTRAELDNRLSALLKKIEHYWISGFKGIFSPIKINQEALQVFKRKFLSIIRMNIPTRSHRNHGPKPVEIDDFVIELFLRLGDPSALVTTEPLEDLIYFVLDILLFHGEENAYDEVDIDNIYVQTETLMTEYLALHPNPESYSHTILILGKELHSIPWESIPCLRGQSISRIPSVSLCISMLQKSPLSISKTNGAFIINPAGDLSKTEERFSDCLKHFREQHSWEGICGMKPTEDQFSQYLQCSIFLYVGHGSGTSYIRETTIKKLPRVAPSLLLGCSSVALIDNNLLEPSGTVLSYLVAGCPMIVGNLWDVTDKDIDKFTLGLFKKWGLKDGEVGNTVCDAVRLSRDECKLQYLNGAAPVVYGLPMKLQ